MKEKLAVWAKYVSSALWHFKPFDENGSAAFAKFASAGKKV